MTAPGERLAAISRWLDESPSYVDCHPETVLWRRVTKVSAEAGEAVDALSGMVGENPRKGVTHTRDELIGELLDAAVAALGAVEHLTGNEGDSWGLLRDKIERVCERAGISEAAINPGCCWKCFKDSGTTRSAFMLVCGTCGNKRCPRASDHSLDCSGSNEAGQTGSVYGARPVVAGGASGGAS